MNLNKGVSTPIAVLLIIVISIAVGAIVWQLKDVESPEPEPTEPQATTSEEEPTTGKPSDYTTQSTCEEAGYYWYDQVCHEGEIHLPQFKNYPAEAYEGKIAEPDFSVNPETKQFITRITEGVEEKEINFAGKFILITWGCGTNCQAGAMVNAKNGVVHQIPISELGRGYKVNSRLLVINPPSKVEPIFSADPQIQDWMSTKYYEWTGKEFKLIKEIEDYSNFFGD